MNYIRKILIFSSHCQSGRKKKKKKDILTVVSVDFSGRSLHSRNEYEMRSNETIRLIHPNKTKKKKKRNIILNDLSLLRSSCNVQPTAMSDGCARRFTVVAFQSKKWFEVKENETKQLSRVHRYLRLIRICIIEARTFNCKKEKKTKQKKILERQNVTVIGKLYRVRLYQHIATLTVRYSRYSDPPISYNYNIEVTIMISADLALRTISLDACTNTSGVFSLKWQRGSKDGAMITNTSFDSRVNF